MKSNNVIELNGKLYDAKTGTLLSKPSATKKAPAAKPAIKQTPKFVDGFSPNKTGAVKTNPTKQTTAKTVSPQAVKKNVPSRVASPNVGLKTKHSVTLNRRAVKAPVITSSAKKPATQHISSSALHLAEKEKLERLSHIIKSPSIARFNKAALPAQDTPLTNQLHTAKAVTESRLEKRSSTKEKLIQKAMAASTVYPQKTSKKIPKVQKHERHFSRYISTALVTLAIAGYVAYLNVPSISMKVAAHRAGFAATLPGYNPSGYSLNGPIAYSPGQVTVNFKSNTDDRKFALNQHPTSWDSTALLENFVTKQDPNYQPFQDRGLTIYIYNGSSAAWVNNGKLYNVTGGNSQLDTDQLLKLATSV